MPPKDKGKGKGKKKEVDWASDELFDKNRSMVYIEHTLECPIFAKKAEEFVNYLREQVPERSFQLVRNQNGRLKPRPGAYEIKFSQTARTSLYDLWSGIDKGPPRRDKFPPNYDELMPEVRKVLKKFYPDPKDIKPEEEEDYGDDEW